MGTARTDELRKDAERIALTSGFSRKQIADDLGIAGNVLRQLRPQSPKKTLHLQCLE